MVWYTRLCPHGGFFEQKECVFCFHVWIITGLATMSRKTWNYVVSMQHQLVRTTDQWNSSSVLEMLKRILDFRPADSIAEYV